MRAPACAMAHVRRPKPKVELQNLATGLVIHACHYPPGTSKWNKIEHRLFCHITQNWRGWPLTDRLAVVELIGATTTKTGLTVESALDTRSYQKGIKVSKAEMNRSITAGTAMHHSKLPLTAWFWAAHLMATHSNGMSARQLEDQLGVTYKTAWLLTQKLRRSMVDPDREPLEGVVEVDQAEIPFREGDAFFEPGNAGKILVIGAVEVIDRGVNQARPRRKHAKYLDTRSGRIRLAMIANNSARSIEAFVKANVKRGTTLITDGHASYPGLTGYRHDPRIVGKMAGHIVLPWIHRAFSLMKRWSLGTYHGLRRKHVDTYLNEFVFRYNRRFHRHVSFEALLGLAAHYEPACYWDIVKRDNPRKRAETLRRASRRSKTATQMRQDGAPPAQGVRRDQPIKPA